VRRSGGRPIDVFSDFDGRETLRRAAHCCVFCLLRGCGAPAGGLLMCFLTFAEALLRFLTLEGIRCSGGRLIAAISDFGGGAALRREAY